MVTSTEGIHIEAHLFSRGKELTNSRSVQSFWTSPSLLSVIQFQPELNDARIARRQDSTEGRRFSTDIVWAECRMVEGIEQLRPKLGISAVVHVNLFGDREI